MTLLTAWASTRSEKFQSLIKAQPRMLFHRGQFLAEALKLERVTREEIMAAVRAQGQSDLAQVESVVLETDGTFSVLSKTPPGLDSAVANVIRPRPGERQQPRHPG